MKRQAIGSMNPSTMVAVFVLAFSSSALGQVEPGAGTWKTWAISSGKDYRVPPPPDAAATKGELAWLRDFVAQNNSQIAQQFLQRVCRRNRAMYTCKLC